MNRLTLFSALATFAVVGCGRTNQAVTPPAQSAPIAFGTNMEGAPRPAPFASKDAPVKPAVKTKLKDAVPASGETVAKKPSEVKPALKAAKPAATTPQKPKASPHSADKDKVKASDLGLPLYPGSIESDDAGPSLISDDAEAIRVISYRFTNDEPSKVLAFYKGKIRLTRDGDEMANTVCCGGKTSTLIGTLPNGAEAKLVATLARGKTKTVIMVTVKTKKK
ncbi:MAG: hypothetical protein ACYC96_02410 [Fimbriimonadaceae bacterium]